jgi:16S rRNA processing protein RimM
LTGPRVLVGVVAAAHGIKGEVKVKTYTESPDRLGAYGPVTMEDGGMLEIAALRATKRDEAVVRFAGIADRNAAETLKGVRLYVARAALPAPGPGEFYHADLVGLAAEDSSGNRLGTVHAVHNFGAGDVLEITFAGGATEFLPFTDAFVPLVDILAGRIVVVLPRDAEDEE